MVRKGANGLRMAEWSRMVRLGVGMTILTSKSCFVGIETDEALPLHQAPAISLPSLDSQEAPRNFRLASSPLRWAVDGLLALERKQL